MLKAGKLVGQNRNLTRDCADPPKTPLPPAGWLWRPQPRPLLAICYQFADFQDRHWQRAENVAGNGNDSAAIG
jgi:hypothetical protein